MAFRWDNISDAIVEWARLRPDAPAIHEGDAKISYGQFATLVSQATVYLNELGIRSGDMVGVATPTNADHIILVFALLRIGAVAIDIPLVRPAHHDPFKIFGITRVLTTANAPPVVDATVHTIGPDWRASIASKTGDVRASNPPDRLLHFSLTSGSTGGPRGVLTTQSQWNGRFQSALQLFPDVLTPERPPVLIVAGEVSFSAFFFFLANQICIGGPVVVLGLVDRLDEIIAAIDRWDDSVFLITPPLCRDLLARPPGDGPLFRRVRAMVVGASPLFADEKHAITQRITPNFYEVYGNAATGFISALRPHEIAQHARSVGRIASGIEVQIVDLNGNALPAGAVGHVRCRGPGVSQGFYGRNIARGATEGFVDGWYYPEDIAALDDAGYIHLKGRTSDMIRRRGVEIFAPELEEVLATHPSVKEVAVVAVAAGASENQIIAVVVPRGEQQLEAVAEHCRARLPTEKFPDQLFWVEALPKTGTGKVDRAALQSSLQKKLSGAPR